MNLEKLEKVCMEHEKIIELLEKEILNVCKINRNLELQLEDLENEEYLTMAWVSAYPKE